MGTFSNQNLTTSLDRKYHWHPSQATIYCKYETIAHVPNNTFPRAPRNLQSQKTPSYIIFIISITIQIPIPFSAWEKERKNEPSVMEIHIHSHFHAYNIFRVIYQVSLALDCPFVIIQLSLL